MIRAYDEHGNVAKGKSIGKSEAIYEFIQKFEKRTQLRQMSKSECISTMYDIWYENYVSGNKDIQEDKT